MLCRNLMCINHFQIVCLDEATANVDLQTSSAILDTIRTEFKHNTVITIAHRQVEDVLYIKNCISLILFSPLVMIILRSSVPWEWDLRKSVPLSLCL